MPVALVRSSLVAGLTPDRPIALIEMSPGVESISFDASFELVDLTNEIWQSWTDQFGVETIAEFACHDASCRPPGKNGGTGGSNSSARIPSRKPKSGGDSSTTLGLENLSPDNIARQISRLHEVGAVPREYDTVEKVIGFMEKNIQTVLDATTPEQRSAWKQWYPAANNLGKDLATETKIPHEAANAMIAALSPGTEWDTNVAMARSAARTLSRNEPITKEVAARANVLRQETWAREMEAFSKKHGKAQSERDALQAEHDDPSTDAKTKKALAAKIAKKDAILSRGAPAQPSLDTFKAGTRPSDLDDAVETAYLLRATDPNPRVLEIVANPDGSYSDSNPRMTKGGTEMKGAWQSYENIAKTVRIYRDPSFETISAAMGEAHKVRTFYNNINDPFNKLNEATIDTHSAGISVGVPLSINHPWIASGGSSIMSSPNHTADGTTGTYAIMAEAHRRVAERNGLLPRELQSITWEQWRRQHDPASRSKLSQAANKKGKASS